MSTFEALRGSPASFTSTKVAALLILSILLWATGAPVFLDHVKAAQLTSVSDTLSDSDLSALSSHTISYTTATSTLAGQTIEITFDPDTSAFTEAYSSATSTDITATGMTVVDDATSCTGAASEVYPEGFYNDDADEYLRFTVCSGDTLAAGTKTITIGAATQLITNPGSNGSYRITLDGTMDDQGETRVYIIDNVVVTASVDTTFTFTVAPLSSGSSVNGDTTSTTTTATAIDFGALAPGTPVVAGQRLTVTTNARNGFSVTVQEDQNLQSATGADIDLFPNGTAASTPVDWSANPPSNTLGDEDTYGHIGVTSGDSDLGGTYGVPNSGEFVGTLYAGDIDTPREIFSHNEPSDGTTADIGQVDVAYKIQIESLQEAGNDYTNTLWYVATPTF